VNPKNVSRLFDKAIPKKQLQVHVSKEIFDYLHDAARLSARKLSAVTEAIIQLGIAQLESGATRKRKVQ